MILTVQGLNEAVLAKRLAQRMPNRWWRVSSGNRALIWAEGWGQGESCKPQRLHLKSQEIVPPSDSRVRNNPEHIKAGHIRNTSRSFLFPPFCLILLDLHFLPC